MRSSRIKSCDGSDALSSPVKSVHRRFHFVTLTHQVGFHRFQDRTIVFNDEDFVHSLEDVDMRILNIPQILDALISVLTLQFEMTND